jgi:hypothetical protein
MVSRYSRLNVPDHRPVYAALARDVAGTDDVGTLREPTRQELGRGFLPVIKDGVSTPKNR